MEDQERISTPQAPSGGGIEGKLFGAPSLAQASSSAIAGWRGRTTRDGQPARKPGRPLGRKNSASGSGPIDPASQGLAPDVSSVPMVDRPLVEKLFETVIKGLDDHFSSTLKEKAALIDRATGGTLKAQLAEIVSSSRVSTEDIVVSKTAFGSLCEKYNLLGAYAPEIVFVISSGKIAAGWWMSSRRLEAVLLEVKALIAKQEKKNEHPASAT